MANWHIGIIGGSGLYEPGELQDAQEIAVGSSFGEPSASVHTGTIENIRFTFMPRHGAGHGLPPSSVNYRANIDVMKRCGVTDLLAISAVGSLREEMAPGQFVAVTQIIDRTVARERSFFGPGLVAHVPLADPTCPRMTGYGVKAAKKAGAIVHSSGCYVAIEGPQFSTRAESHMYRGWGADLVGMTAMPEARLAREAELPYALLGMVTDYDCWRTGDDVNVTDIMAVMGKNGQLARAALIELAKALPKKRSASPIDTVLDSAIITPRDQWDQGVASRLDAVASRLQ